MFLLQSRNDLTFKSKQTLKSWEIFIFPQEETEWKNDGFPEKIDRICKQVVPFLEFAKF